MSTQSLNATATTDVPPPEPRFDFPTWLPPMLVKELRQGLRTRGFVGSMVGFQVVMVIAFIWAFAVKVFGDSQAQETVNGFFWGVLGVMLLVITPLRAMAGLRQEVESRTMDLMMLTRLTAWRIVLGKWTSLLVQAALLVLALLPYGLVRYFFGEVDLMKDLLGLGAMYFGCGMLTALGLWVSGMPKLLRIGAMIGVVLMTQGMFGLFGAHSHGLFSITPSSAAGWMITALMIFNFVLLLVFGLVQAVRRIAPPAENHSPLVRGLGLAALAPIPLLALADVRMAAGQGFMAFFGLALVSVIELPNLFVPMSVHVRTWWDRGRWGAWIGRFVLPGWPSAALFAAFWLGLLGVVALADFIPDSPKGADLAWLMVLLWGALVFPMALLSFWPQFGRVGLAAYFILQVAFGIITIFAANRPTIEPVGLFSTVFGWLAEVMPVTSFWLRLTSLDRHPFPENDHLIAQAVIMVGVVVLVVWRSAPYWRSVRKAAASVRSEPKMASDE